MKNNPADVGWAERRAAHHSRESRTEFSKSGGHGKSVPTLRFSSCKRCFPVNRVNPVKGFSLSCDLRFSSCKRCFPVNRVNPVKGFSLSCDLRFSSCKRCFPVNRVNPVKGFSLSCDLYMRGPL